MIILGVGITVLAVLGVGIIVAKKIDGDSENFLVAGRRLGVPPVPRHSDGFLTSWPERVAAASSERRAPGWQSV